MARANGGLTMAMLALIAFLSIYLLIGPVAEFSKREGAREGRRLRIACEQGSLGYMRLPSGRTANFCYRTGSDVILYDTQERNFFITKWQDGSEIRLPQLPPLK